MPTPFKAERDLLSDAQRVVLDAMVTEFLNGKSVSGVALRHKLDGDLEHKYLVVRSMVPRLAKGGAEGFEADLDGPEYTPTLRGVDSNVKTDTKAFARIQLLTARCAVTDG
jgi:hypothetical protein